MIKNQIFNLEKIEEISNPIKELQAGLNRLEENHEDFMRYSDVIAQAITQKKFLEQFHNLNEKINIIHTNLIKITNNNLNRFLNFKDNLIKKYKEFFKENILNLNLDQSYLSFEIGKSLIENKKISKIIEKSSFIYSITSKEWSDLLDSLKKNSLYLSTIRNVEKFFNSLKNIIEEVPTIEKVYEEEKQFKSSKEKNISVSMEEYFKYSPRELERRERKKRREKLKDLQSKPLKEIELNQEISEKIEKYKSKLESSFKEKYFIQKDEDTDPLDLIRERKKTKEDEYKSFIKKIKNNKEK